MKTSTDIIDDMTNLTEFSVIRTSDMRVVFTSHNAAIAKAFAALRNSLSPSDILQVKLTA